MNKRVVGGLAVLIIAIVAVIAVGVALSGTKSSSPLSATILSAPAGTEQDFTLVAAPASLTIHKGLTVPAYAYNATVPGPSLQVHVGDNVHVTLVNHLPEATTIHWHGLIAPNNNDGIPGVTQDAVLPGKSYTYDFVPQEPGTYLYHAHQDTAIQIDMGLYGALVVLPRHATSVAAVDRTLVLDDWNIPRTGNASAKSHNLLLSTPIPNLSLHPYLTDPGMAEYATFTVNGHSYPETDLIQELPGTVVRLRLLNAGFVTHVLHLHGAQFRLVATDSVAVHAPQLTGDLLPIAAGQRMDIEFRMPKGTWSLHDHDDRAGADQMRVLVGQGTQQTAADRLADRATSPPLLDLAHYGLPASSSINDTTHMDQKVEINIANPPGPQGPGMADNVYFMNHNIYPGTPPIIVKTGQHVELIFKNTSRAAHPMALDGHHLRVLVLNDERVTGSPLYQDTVMSLPGKTTIVAFTASNPGVWMLQCYEMHHALGGMDELVQYQGYTSQFQMGGSTGNQPY